MIEVIGLPKQIVNYAPCGHCEWAQTIAANIYTYDINDWPSGSDGR